MTAFVRLHVSNATSGLTLLAVLVIGGGLAPWLAPDDPFRSAGAALVPPGIQHLFGTDDLGRDVFAGVLHGAWTSLCVGSAAAAISAIVGLFVGGVAGMRGGGLDQALMRVTEFVQALPRFFLVVMVVSLFGSSLPLIILMIGLTSWPASARLFRAQVRATIARDFVAAAQAAGGTDSGILRRHVLPLTLSVLMAEASYQAGGAIVAEAGLSFLGLGDPTVMSWGTQLGSAQYFVREAWWMSLFPGLAIMLTALGFNLLADSMLDREVVQPIRAAESANPRAGGWPQPTARPG